MTQTEIAAEYLSSLPKNEKNKVVDECTELAIKRCGRNYELSEYFREVVRHQQRAIMNAYKNAEEKKERERLKNMSSAEIANEIKRKNKIDSIKASSKTLKNKPKTIFAKAKKESTTTNIKPPVRSKKEMPSVSLTGIDNMIPFRFTMSDTDKEIREKVGYIRQIIKGKDNLKKESILKYYEIHIDAERRNNQFYYYGWKNLNGRKYKFYVGKKASFY